MKSVLYYFLLSSFSLFLSLDLDLDLGRGLGCIWALDINPVFPDEGIIGPSFDTFFNPETDYTKMRARITDRSPDNNIIKIEAESHNIHFLRMGDAVNFESIGQTERECKGFVRGVEERYATLYVPNAKDCLVQDEPLLRIGMQLNITSPVMKERILFASQYRYILIKRREDTLKQLNGVNHFLWSYEQEVVKQTAEFDKKILELKSRRQRALDDIISKKKDQVVMQQALIKEMDFLDENLAFYRIDRQEPMTDRWNMDKDSTLSIYSRPPNPIPISEQSAEQHRWYNDQDL